MFNIGFNRKFKPFLKVPFSQGGFRISWRISRSESKFNRQIRHKGTVISDGACLAYVFLMIKIYGNFILEENRNIINLDKFFHKLKIEFNHKKNDSFLYYWMAIQDKYLDNELKTIEKSAAPYFNLNKESRKKDTSYELFSFFLSSNDYSLRSKNSKWSYEGTINGFQTLEPAIKLLFDYLKKREGFQKYDICIEFVVSIGDPFMRYFTKETSGHALNTIICKNGSKYNFIFFDPNLGVYHFTKDTDFKLFIMAILNGVYFTEEFDAHIFFLKDIPKTASSTITTAPMKENVPSKSTWKFWKKS